MLAANLLPVMEGGGCSVLLRSGSIVSHAFHGRGNWAAITGIGRWLLPFYLRMHRWDFGLMGWWRLRSGTARWVAAWKRVGGEKYLLERELPTDSVSVEALKVARRRPASWGGRGGIVQQLFVKRSRLLVSGVWGRGVVAIVAWLGGQRWRGAGGGGVGWEVVGGLVEGEGAIRISKYG
jgi:hypothetical protein